MKITHVRYLQGPNLRSDHSGLLVQLALGTDAKFFLGWRPDTAEMDRALNLLRAVVPELAPLAGGDIDVLRQSRQPAAHLLLAACAALLQDHCILPAAGRVVAANRQQSLLFVPCDDRPLGLLAFKLAAACVAGLPALARGTDRGFVAGLREIRQTFLDHVQQNGLNQNALSMARAAALRDIPCYRIRGSNRLVQLGQGCHRRWLNGAVMPDTSSTGMAVAHDKLQTATLLATHGLPVTSPRLAHTLEQARQAARALGWPVVVKPRSTNKGVGVSTDISNADELELAFAQAMRYDHSVLIEKHIPGDDHRLLVVDGRFTAAARRMAAQVTGDGVRTVRQLVAALKRSRQQGLSDVVFIKGADVALDQEAARVLRHQGLDFDTVPATGRAVRLRGNANMSTGGTSVDVTREVHPDNRLLAERAARLIGLPIAGIDYQTTDIGRSWRAWTGAILEINAGPGLEPHLSATPDHDVPNLLLDHLFLAGGNGRVPLAGITGSLGKTTTCRMLAHILSAAGHVVALASTQGTFIGNETVRTGDLASGVYGAELLLDPTVTAGVFEMARGGLIKRGLGVDRVDVGAVLNVMDNRIGLEGMNSREDLARVKGLVPHNARSMAVLNADDPLCLAMKEGLQAPLVCLVSDRADNAAVPRHLAAGGMAVILEDRRGIPSIVLRRGDSMLGEMPVTDIPATWQGGFRPAILNAMFATAIASGMGIDFGISRKALGAFESSYATNPGRMNFIPGLPFQLLLTWADGPQALQELVRFVQGSHRDQGKTLVFYSIGNRPDDFIIDSAKAVAGGFTRYVCTEMEEDLRGRRPGEVADLLARGLREAGVPDDAIWIELSCEAANRHALSSTPAGALLVIETYHHEKVMAAVRKMTDKKTSIAGL